MTSTSISAAAKAVVYALLLTNNRRATKFLSSDLVVKLTRRYKAGKGGNETFLLTIGTPNHEERKFVVPFPVRKVQLRAFPRKRK